MIPSREKLKSIKDFPLSVMLVLVTAALTTVFNQLFATVDNRNDDCLEQVTYLRDRVEKLEKQLDSYTTAVMFQEARVKNRDLIIDSLRREKEVLQ